jgi:hypothetical protein
MLKNAYPEDARANRADGGNQVPDQREKHGQKKAEQVKSDQRYDGAAERDPKDRD